MPLVPFCPFAILSFLKMPFLKMPFIKCLHKTPFMKVLFSCPTKFFRSEQRNIAQSNVLANWSPQQCLQRFHQRLSAINCGLFMPRWVFHCEAAQMSFAKFFQQAGWHKLPYKTFVVKLKTILKLHKIHQPRSHLITASFLHISEFWWNCLG